MHGCPIFRCDRECQLPEFHRAQRLRGRLHEHAAGPVPLKSRQDTDLRGVTHAGGNFTSQHRSYEVIAARVVKDKRRAGNELAASRQQDNVL